MKKIKTYSKTKFKYTLIIYEFNAISAAKAFKIPHEACKPFDIDNFFYEFELKHNILNIVAEDIKSYSYS